MNPTGRFFLLALSLTLCLPRCSYLQSYFQTKPETESMTRTRLQEIVSNMAEERAAKIEGDFVDFRFGGVKLACISDENFDRMRIIAPIADASKLSPAVLHRLLEANFSSTIDARYATLDGTLYAAYLHPLSSLTEEQVRAAVNQVASLHRTYGTSYSSGALEFGNGSGTGAEAPGRGGIEGQTTEL